MDKDTESLQVEVGPTDDGTAVVAVAGELDVHTAPTLSEGLGRAFDAGATTIVIDAERLRFCDSSGIQVLVQARERALDLDGRVTIANAHGSVAKVLSVTGLLELFGADTADSTD